MSLRYYLQWGKGLNKVAYYALCGLNYAAPKSLYRGTANRYLESLTDDELTRATERADYYNRMPVCRPGADWKSIADFKYPRGEKHHHSTYFFELYRWLKYFDPADRMAYLFGDITEEPQQPTFVKSRPITSGPTNSVIMKLDRIRHFQFVNDRTPWRDKKDMIVSRNVVWWPKRQRLLDRWFGHPMCNLGQVNTNLNHNHPEWIQPFMSIEQQLGYKFIACIEGNDVATNLKWVMGSNSIAVTPRPEYETWYMEGALKPDYHYIEVRPDFADLIDKLTYYVNHPDEAEQIIANAHAWVDSFMSARIEKAASLLVVKKYMERSGQNPN
ncbi:MAG: glycosyltransferase [Muribaculaceae bacterium]|nr:glycosyltransferase [Muribaculaceae bacterium]